MIGVAAGAWLPSLFLRGGGMGVHDTAADASYWFIPFWMVLTIGVCVISFYFTKYLMTAEKHRDSETVPQTPAPVHPH